MLDDIDRKILMLLQNDAMLRQSRIARAIGLPTSTVNDRISRMRKNGTIKNLVANIDPSKAGLTVLAFISVLIDWNKSNETFSAAVKKMPEVLECHNVTGDWSYLLKVRAINNSSLETVDQTNNVEKVVSSDSATAPVTTKGTKPVHAHQSANLPGLYSSTGKAPFVAQAMPVGQFFDVTG